MSLRETLKPFGWRAFSAYSVGLAISRLSRHKDGYLLFGRAFLSHSFLCPLSISCSSDNPRIELSIKHSHGPTKPFLLLWKRLSGPSPRYLSKLNLYHQVLRALVCIYHFPNNSFIWLFFDGQALQLYTLPLGSMLLSATSFLLTLTGVSHLPQEHVCLLSALISSSATFETLNTSYTCRASFIPLIAHKFNFSPD